MEDKLTLAEKEEGLTIIVSRNVAVPLDVYVRTSHKSDDGDGPVQEHRHGIPHSINCSLRKMSASDVREFIDSMCKPKDVMEDEISSGNNWKNETMDKNACLACVRCGFMTYSTKHLLKHSDGEHTAMVPKFVRKIISISASARVRLADALFYCRLINEMLLEREEEGGSMDQTKAPSFQALANWTSREEDLNSNYESGCIKVKMDPSGDSLCHKVSENTNFMVEIDVDGDLFQRNPAPLFEGVENEFPNYLEEYPDCQIRMTRMTIGAGGEETQEPPKAHVKENKSVVTSERTMQEEIYCPPLSSRASHQGEMDDLKLKEQVHRVKEAGVKNAVLINAQASECQGVYQKHNLVHSYKRGYTREKPLLCGECFQPFYRWVDLHTHTRAHRQDLLWKNTPSSLNTTKKPNSNVYTNLTSDSQRKQVEKSLHIKADSSKNSLKSNDGGKSQKMCEFGDGNSTLIPTKTPAKEMPRHMCKKCGLNFSDVTSFCAHMRTHQQRLRPYKCKYCAKFFLVHTTFIQHMKSHRGEMMLKNSSHRYVEKRVANGIDSNKIGKSTKGQKLFCCCLCEQRFEMRSTFDSHMKRHRGEKPFECKECGKRFFWRSSLDNHMRLHTGKKLFWCHFCGRKFPQRVGFLRHLRIHTGEKPFKCDCCKKPFNDVSSLKRHVRIHSGERPYQCDECGKTFNHSGLFNRHMKQHKGMKNFQCEVCAKAFIDYKGLKRHQKVH